MQASKSITSDAPNGIDANDNLANAMGNRVKQALEARNSEPLRCSACRTAGIITLASQITDFSDDPGFAGLNM